MGVTDAPPWLLPAFVRTCLAAGATAPREEIEAAGQRLIDRWRESGRHFHDLRHVVDVLARVDELAEETHRPDVVRLAAWYHGAVFSSAAGKAYARSGGEDERASAELAREELTALGLPAKVTDRVHRLIVNLRRHDADPADVDCLALCDADLATLAVEPQRYEDYRRAVREEYAHIPLRDYLSARIAILSRLLDRRNLFLSPMGARWEDAARENLAAELGRLRSKLATLGDADGHEVGTPSATSPAEAPTDGAATADPGAVPVPAGTDGPAPEPQAPVGGMEARVLRSPEPRPSSLETDPEELGLRRTARAPSTTDPERARRAERAKIAERGRARVEQAMRDRARAPGAAREPGHRTAAAATPRTAPSPATATPPTAPTPPDVEHPVRETGPEPAPPPEHRSEARDTDPATTAPDGARHAADATEPSRQDGRTHGMERDPELLEPAHRRRQRERRAPQRPTGDGDGPGSTARPPRRRGPG